MSKPRVQYFFAFGSPYAALADARIDELVADAGGELEPVPVVPPPSDPPTGLVATLQAMKRSYMEEDATRCAAELGLPWKFPWSAVPTDSTLAAEGWYCAREGGAERAYRNAVFRAFAGEGRDIEDREVLADCATGAGLDREAFLEVLRSHRYADEVPKAIGLCLETGVFGVPLFAVNGKRFWGNDRVEALLRELRG